MLSREDKRDRPEYWSARDLRGMVATAHYRATSVAAEVLADGGNAVDAAVAAALALAVCESAGSGLGGMAMMLVHLGRERRTVLVRGACRAPAAATPAVVARSRRYRGYRAVAVPMHLAVLRHALERYGSLPLERLIAPAIELAVDGFPLTRLQVENVQEYLPALRRSTAAPFFLDPDGRPYSPGTTFRQPVLGATLRRLSQAGLEDFYQGQIARDIVDDMRAHGGFLTLADLASAAAREVDPIEGTFDGATVRTIGPPGGGATLLQMLNMIQALPEAIDLDSPRGIVLMAALIRRARYDRRRFRLRTGAEQLGAAQRLLSSAYARRAAGEVMESLDARATRAVGEARVRDPPPLETSHVSVMDAAGNVVALTQSIERSFGAAVVTPSLGFLYNGYLRAYKVANPRHPHFLRRGAPARSNAAPTIVLRDDQPTATLGSTGSERMNSGIVEVLVRLRRNDPFAAVHAPRLHATPEGTVLAEVDRLPAGAVDALQRVGFAVKALAPYSFKMGGLQLVVKRKAEFIGVGEPRRDSAASGPWSRDGRVTRT